MEGVTFFEYITMSVYLSSLYGRQQKKNAEAKAKRILAQRDNIPREEWARMYPTAILTPEMREGGFPQHNVDETGRSYPEVSLFNASEQFRNVEAYEKAKKKFDKLKKDFKEAPQKDRPKLGKKLQEAARSLKLLQLPEAGKTRLLGQKYNIRKSQYPAHNPKGDIGKIGSAVRVVASLPFAAANSVENVFGYLTRRNQPIPRDTSTQERIDDFNAVTIPQIEEAWRFCYSSYRPGAYLDGYYWQELEYMGENGGFYAYKGDWSIPNSVDVVFAFRGTQSQRDTIDDVMSAGSYTIHTYFGRKLPVPVTGGWGPARRVAGLDHQLRDPINRILNFPEAIHSIMITGHSLGGGSAAVFAAVFVQLIPEELLPKVNYVSFSAMRGLKESTLRALLMTTPGKYLDEHGIRVFNERDQVPNLPPRGSGFTHIGRAIRLGGELVRGLDNRGLMGLAGDMWDEEQGPHSMNPTTVSLFRISDYQDKPEFDSWISEVSGRGTTKSKRKGRFVKGSKEAKLYMARLRAMRKK